MLVSFHQALSQQESQDSVGTFNLINAYGLCLASDGNWGDNDNNLVQWECLPEIGQQWSYNNSNFFAGSDRRICNDFMKCIKAVPGESRLVQFDPDDRDVQQFTLVPSHRNDYWYIMNDDGNCLSGSSKIGDLVTLSTCTYHSPMQNWKRLNLNPQGSFSMPIVDPLTFPTDLPLKLPTEFPQFNPLFLSPFPHFSSSSRAPLPFKRELASSSMKNLFWNRSGRGGRIGNSGWWVGCRDDGSWGDGRRATPVFVLQQFLAVGGNKIACIFLLFPTLRNEEWLNS